MGFGLLGAANAVEPIEDEDAAAMLAQCFALGIRLFDTAPLYGGRRSEARLGGLLKAYERSDFALSTKVGRYRTWGQIPDKKNHLLGSEFDYSYDRTLKSVEESMRLLGSDHLDIVHIHDCDDHVDAALSGAFKALRSLRVSGVVGGISLGVMNPDTAVQMLSREKFDCVMIAGRYSLLNHTALHALIPLCQKQNTDIINAAPFNSGILAVGPVPGVRYDYAISSPEIIAKVEKIVAVCQDFEIHLKRAALQFAAAPDVVKSVALGLVSPDLLQGNLYDLTTPIPAEFWARLKAETLLDEAAIVPKVTTL